MMAHRAGGIAEKLFASREVASAIHAFIHDGNQLIDLPLLNEGSGRQGRSVR